MESSLIADTTAEARTPPQKSIKISKAMKAYLQRAKEHDEFMKIQIAEFEAGRRHLANIMGRDADTFTQEDIDNAIEYLLPAGIYDKKARPMMRHPTELFPSRKAAEFDASGRPYHYMFYTKNPHFYETLHDIVAKFQKLDKLEDQMMLDHLSPEERQTLILDGTAILSKQDLEAMINEEIGEYQYAYFTETLERFIQHPCADSEKDFIMKFRKPVGEKTKEIEMVEPKYDETGRAYMEASTTRKRATAHIIVRVPGTGKIGINGTDISYFAELQPREQILFPLQITNTIGTVDVEATAESGGPSSQAGAIRLGIALCLKSFVDPHTVERMKLAGLLQQDVRTPERKKPGQWKARKKFTWRKR